MDQPQNPDQPQQPSPTTNVIQTPPVPETPTLPLAAATVTPGETTVAPSPIPPVGNNQNPTAKKSTMLPIIIGILIVLVIIAAGAFFFMHKQSAVQSMATKRPMVVKPNPTKKMLPAVTPVTSANVDQTLNNTNASVQQATNQVNADLNSIGSINTSQDNTSTSGL